MAKKVILDQRAGKEISKFPKEVRKKIKAYIEILESNGKLKEPFAKRVGGIPALYEIRIKSMGIWRVFYAYLGKTEIIILSALHKKTQKTPLKEINKAKRRLNEYL